MMADDDNRPSSPPPSAFTPASSAAEPLRPLPGDEEAIPAREPSMAAGAADFATPDRPPEAFAPAASAAAPRRSLMPTVLALIGAVLIVLLATNLYMLANPPANDAIPALRGEVASLKQRLGAVDPAPLAGQVTRQGQDLAALKAAVDRNTGAVGANAATQAALPALDAKVDDLGKRLDTLGGTVAALPRVDLAPLEASLAAFDKRLQPVEAYFDAPKATTQVTEARQNGSAAQTRAAPIAVIAQAIQAAIPAGRPFATETKALANLGVDAAALGPLEALAPTGAATDAALTDGFAAVQDPIVVAAAPVSTGTMIDRMMANAASIVTVTRTGAASGDGAGAVASRVAAALKAGDLRGAAAQWSKLPEASQARGAEWVGRLKARIAAEDAARAIAANAVDALAAAP